LRLIQIMVSISKSKKVKGLEGGIFKVFRLLYEPFTLRSIYY